MQAHNNNVAAQRGLGVLIADDNADTALTLAALLRDVGHVVHTCANAHLVLELVQRYKPDVCILDIVMPGKNGFDLARDIRALNLGQRPVLIGISAVYTVPNEKLIARGFDHFLQKPAYPDALLGLLDSIARPGPQSA